MANTPEPPDNPIYQQLSDEYWATHPEGPLYPLEPLHQEIVVTDNTVPLSVEPGTLAWLLEVMPGPEWFEEQLLGGLPPIVAKAFGNHIHGNLIQYLQNEAEKDA